MSPHQLFNKSYVQCFVHKLFDENTCLFFSVKGVDLVTY